MVPAIVDSGCVSLKTTFSIELCHGLWAQTKGFGPHLSVMLCISQPDTSMSGL